MVSYTRRVGEREGMTEHERTPGECVCGQPIHVGTRVRITDVQTIQPGNEVFDLDPHDVDVTSLEGTRAVGTVLDSAPFVTKGSTVSFEAATADAVGCATLS